jgi:hypothetical protein
MVIMVLINGPEKMYFKKLPPQAFILKRSCGFSFIRIDFRLIDYRKNII